MEEEAVGIDQEYYKKIFSSLSDFHNLVSSEKIDKYEDVEEKEQKVEKEEVEDKVDEDDVEEIEGGEIIINVEERINRIKMKY